MFKNGWDEERIVGWRNNVSTRGNRKSEGNISGEWGSNWVLGSEAGNGVSDVRRCGRKVGELIMSIDSD